MQALIDGDILVYSCGFAAQKNVHRIFIKGEEEYGYIASFNYKKQLNEYMELHGLEEQDVDIETSVEVEPLENCLHSVKQTLNSILEETQADSYRIFLTGEGNFREQIATIAVYKGNRDPDHKPHWYREIKDYLINVWSAEVVDGQEADDAMGIAQGKDYWWTYAQGYHQPFGTTICSVDKDMRMIPGWHYNIKTGVKDFVTEEQGLRTFYLQLLMGDSTDNIIGIPGIGKKKAERILEGLTTEEGMYWACFSAYEDAFCNDTEIAPTEMSVEDILIENARLLWIRRKPEEMWEPPI